MATRRDALLALPALSAAALTRAQVPKRGAIRRIGELSITALPPGVDLPGKLMKGEERFWERMKELGWILGENLFVERAYAGWKSDRLSDLAAELVRKRVDVITCDHDDATLAAARATQRIPILFDNSFWPVELGFVDSLARPGRNLTGYASYADTSTTAKRLELIRAILPSANRLSWIEGRDTWLCETVSGVRFDYRSTLEVPARGLGFKLQYNLLSKPEEIDQVFESVVAWPAQALLAGGWQVFEARKRIGELSLQHRVPFVAVHRSLAQDGALLSLGWSLAEGRRYFQIITEYLSRILGGTAPAELPVVQPSGFETVVNLRTAKALGLTIPRSVLQRAEEVIE